jgi:hypothetical protein
MYENFVDFSSNVDFLKTEKPFIRWKPSHYSLGGVDDRDVYGGQVIGS